MSSESTTIRWDRDEDGIVVLILDDPNQSANTMNAAYKASMSATVDRLEAEKDEITGVVITSAKKTFFAGGDLNDLKLATKEQSAEIGDGIRDIKRQLRRLETLGKPVVAAINGAALGGGLEICLACHHRIAIDDPKVQLGFPEVQLGLLPGAGGVVRTVRMLGIVDALMQLLLQGQRHRPAKAMELGAPVLAEIGAHGVVAGPDPSLQSQPSNAILKALKREGLTPEDVDLFEINEAFASVAIQSMRDLGITAENVNVNGGAISMGHPVGMSGARIVLHLAHELKRRGGGLGAAGLCGGGGQGDALLLRVSP